MNGYIVYLLEPYNETSKKENDKKTEIYFPNTGLASYLARINSPEMIQSRFLKRKIYRNIYH